MKKMITIKRTALLFGLIAVCSAWTSCGKKLTSLSSIESGITLEEFKTKVDTNVLYIDTTINVKKNGLHLRCIPIQLFAREGILTATIRNDQVIRCDWILGDVVLKIQEVSFLKLNREVYKKNQLRFDKLIGESVSDGDLKYFFAKLSTELADATMHIDGCDTVYIWPNKRISLRLINKRTTIVLSSWTEDSFSNDAVNWENLSLTQDTLIHTIKLGQTKNEILSKLTLRDTNINIPELENASAMVMDYYCWGLPGTLTTVFDKNQNLVGVFWNYSSEGEIVTESLFLNCGEFIDVQNRDKYLPVLNKRFVVGEGLKVWHNDSESIIFAYKESRSLSFAHINTKVYSLPNQYR